MQNAVILKLSLLVLAFVVTTLASPWVNAAKPTRVWAHLPQPSTQITDPNPTFVFTQSRGATRYRLSVRQPGGAVSHHWYNASDVTCVPGKCFITDSPSVSPGVAQWWIRGWNAEGLAPSSNAREFTVVSGGVPLLQIGLSPNKFNVSSPAVTYTWGDDSTATWYQILIAQPGRDRIQHWYTRADSNCFAGRCSVTRTDSLVAGATSWRVRGYNASGTGKYGPPVPFTRTTEKPARVSGLIYPRQSQVLQNQNVRFTWKAVPRAERYQLYIRDSMGERTSQFFDSVQLGCVEAGSVCRVTNASSLAEGNVVSLVRALNSIGPGDYSPRRNFKYVKNPATACFPGTAPRKYDYLSAHYPSIQRESRLRPPTNNACEISTYYRHVDPQHKKKTLDAWLRQHKFLNPGAPRVTSKIDRRYLKPDVINAEYHNMFDLGFGRDMYCKRNGEKANTYPCVVQNYVVSDDLSKPSSKPARFQLSVAMEFLSSCSYPAGAPANCGPTAFYVFDSRGRRVRSVDLDGTGSKSVPEVCLACHSGTYEESNGHVTQLQGGEYLPFNENLFANFHRDSDSTTDTYNPALTFVGINHAKARQLNKLMRRVMPGNFNLITGTTGKMKEKPITSYDDDPSIRTTWHAEDSPQARVLNSFCLMCHSAVQGTYTYETQDNVNNGTNCQLCHDSPAGVGVRTNLAASLCGNDDTVMPNARVAHRAMYYAAQGKPPYTGFTSDVLQFITGVCGSGASLRAPE